MAEHPAPAGRRTWLAALAVLVTLVVILVLLGRPLYGLLADQARVSAWVEQFGPWGPAAISLLEAAQAILAPIPGQAIEAVAGYLFGVWRGTAYAMLGITVGSLTNFGLTRWFGRPLAVRLAGPSAVTRLDELTERGGALFFFLIWLVPFVPDDLACLAAGLTSMSTQRFLILMFLGRVPGIFASTWFGANAARIPPVWWALLILWFALAALALWRWGARLQQAFLAATLEFLQRVAPQKKQ